MASVPNQAPGYLIGHFIWTYAITSTRPLKNHLGIDHNANPREDVDRFGEKSVQSGKITRAQLNMLKRNQAAHDNTLEMLPFFIGSVLFATVAGVPNEKINRACLFYSIARVVYHVLYLLVTDYRLSSLRSITWWVGSLVCWQILWESKKMLA